MFQFLSLIFFFTCLNNLTASAKINATDVRIGIHGEKTRFVLDLSEKIPYEVVLDASKEIQIHFLTHINWADLLKKPKRSFGLVRTYFCDALNAKKSRLKIECQQLAKVDKVFWLKNNTDLTYRLIVDLLPLTISQKEMTTQSVTKGTDVPKIAVIPTLNIIPLPKPKLDHTRRGFITLKKTIVIDPGHGGQDPGTISYSGVNEKQIALDVAKILKEVLEKTGNYEVVLTRDSDIFLRLRERLAIAKKAKADFMLSLHADSSPKPHNRGASIYLLSDEASDAEAEALAAKENKADIILGVDLSENSEEINNILIDLAQRDSLNLAVDCAQCLKEELEKVTSFIQKPIRYADIAVLKAPDIPSILLELGCISNKEDDLLLSRRDHRLKLAKAIQKALDTFFEFGE